MLYVERGGRTVLSWTDDPERLAPSAAALAAAVRNGALGRLTVERADGERAERRRVPSSRAERGDDAPGEAAFGWCVVGSLREPRRHPAAIR